MLKLFMRKHLVRLGNALRGGVRPEFEAVYQRIFDRDVERLGIANEFYPLNSAANYSLMYLVSRLLQTFAFAHVVELGAGQTTLLIDAFRKRGILTGSVVTLEHDEGWRKLVQEKVAHEVQMIPLSNSPYRGGYDLSKANIQPKIDLLLIDGPPAINGKYLSRHSALPLLEMLDQDGFVIVIDDAERQGELELVAQISAVLTKKGTKYRVGDLLAGKRQTVIAAGRFESAAFF